MICVASAGSDAPSVGTGFRRVQDFPANVSAPAARLRCDDSETDDRVDREGCRALGHSLHGRGADSLGHRSPGCWKYSPLSLTLSMPRTSAPFSN